MVATTIAGLSPEDILFILRHYEPVSSKSTRELPPIGTLLMANLEGVEYRARIAPASDFKSGRGVEVLNGPAAGKVYRSLSQAARKATLFQTRLDSKVKTPRSGWDFWLEVSSFEHEEEEEEDGREDAD